MIYDRTLRLQPTPAWSKGQFGQDPETLCYISLEMGAWWADVDDFEVAAGRSFQSLCHEMTVHFGMLHDPDDPSRWDKDDYVAALDAYIVRVQRKLIEYPNWINSDHCSAYGKETVIDLLAKGPPKKKFTAQLYLVASPVVDAVDEKDAKKQIELMAESVLSDISDTYRVLRHLSINEITGEQEED